MLASYSETIGLPSRTAIPPQTREWPVLCNTSLASKLATHAGIEPASARRQRASLTRCFMGQLVRVIRFERTLFGLSCRRLLPLGYTRLLVEDQEGLEPSVFVYEIKSLGPSPLGSLIRGGFRQCRTACGRFKRSLPLRGGFTLGIQIGWPPQS